MLIVSLIMLLLIIFGIMIFFFRKIMTQNVTVATMHLDELSRDYAEKEKRINQQLEEANEKAQEIVSTAQSEAEKIRSETIRQAEQERDKMIQAARTQTQEMVHQADNSCNQLISEMEDRISKEAVKRACDLTHDLLPEEFRKLVHGQWVEDLIEKGFNQAERLRLPEGIEEATLVSAFALSDEQRKRIAKKLKDALGKDLAIKEAVDPKVVAGLVITIGSLVLDGSLKNKIKEKTR
ncbi:MAG: F0F1 ATP synthase subunit delta [Candidatus Omnitrophota bacterium]